MASPPLEQAQISELDLKASGIPTVIWATGYSFDFSLVRLPVLDTDGYPTQKRGVSAYEGLYFLGMPWLHKRKSGILFGVGDDAAYLAERIAARETVPSRCAWVRPTHRRPAFRFSFSSSETS